MSASLRASENLRAAAEMAATELGELPESDKSKIRSPEGRAILAAVENLADKFEAENVKLREEVAGLRACVNDLIAVIRTAAQSHATSLMSLRADIAGLRTEMEVMSAAAVGAQSEAIRAVNLAEAARSYVEHATREVRSERATEPSIPCPHDTDVTGSEFVIPMEHFPKFESDQPPPGQGND